MSGEVIEIKRRVRYGVLPAPAEDCRVPWADAHISGTRTFKEVELRALQVMLITEGKHWRAMREICQEIDNRRGPGFLYASEEIESFLLFAMAAGGKSVKDAYDLLTGDLGGPARRLLGFDRPRNDDRKRERMIRLDGVPSPPTVSRHKERFPAAIRERLWREIEYATRMENLSLPENLPLLRSLGTDGTKVETSHTCPIIDPKTGEIVNADKVTCPTGGYVPLSAGPDKSGHGWNLISASTHNRQPAAWEVVLLPDSERSKGAELVAEQILRDITPLLKGQVGIFTTDVAFHSSPMRKTCQTAGFVPNIHLSSHADTERARKSVERRNKQVFTFPDYPNWRANGHREIYCACGKGKVSKRFYQTNKGEVIPRVEGSCPTCGSITITAGDRRRSATQFIRCHPADTVEQRDYALGNGLTFHDPVSDAHGNARWHSQEGLHSMAEQRFELTSKKRRRSITHVRIDIAMAFTLIHAISMNDILSRREQQDDAPPGDLPLAA